MRSMAGFWYAQEPLFNDEINDDFAESKVESGGSTGFVEGSIRLDKDN